MTKIATPAKVNLFLELLGRRGDGFHEIETVMSSVALYDHLRFSPRGDSKFELSISYGSQGGQPRELDEELLKRNRRSSSKKHSFRCWFGRSFQ